MDHLEGIREKMRQGQIAVSAARESLKAVGAERAMDHLALAQSHLDQASKSLEEGEHLQKASWHIDQVCAEIQLAIGELKG